MTFVVPAADLVNAGTGVHAHGDETQRHRQGCDDDLPWVCGTHPAMRTEQTRQHDAAFGQVGNGHQLKNITSPSLQTNRTPCCFWSGTR